MWYIRMKPLALRPLTQQTTVFVLENYCTQSSLSKVVAKILFPYYGDD